MFAICLCIKSFSIAAFSQFLFLLNASRQKILKLTVGLLLIHAIPAFSASRDSLLRERAGVSKGYPL